MVVGMAMGGGGGAEHVGEWTKPYAEHPYENGLDEALISGLCLSLKLIFFWL